MISFLPDEPVLHESMRQRWEEFLRTTNSSGEEMREHFRSTFERIHPDYAAVSFPPLVFRPSFARELTSVSLQIIDLITSIPQRMFGGNLQRMMQYQGIEVEEAAHLLEFWNPRFRRMATHFARPDYLLTHRGFELVEFNIAPPVGGIGICDDVRTAFLDSPWFRFLRERGIDCVAPWTTEVWRRSILSACRRAHQLERPLLLEATADPMEDLANDFTQPSFVRMVADSGFDLLTGPIQALDISHRGVFFEGRRIDIVFTCFTSSEARRYVSRDLLQRLAQADTKGLVDFIAPPLNRVFDSKVNLAILSSAEFQQRCTPQERRLLREHVPPTFRLDADTAGLARRHPADYVLKPAVEFGGKGVVIGASVPSGHWHACLEEALQGPECFVLQQVIHDCLTVEVEGPGGFRPHTVCISPMLFGREYAGALIRHASCATEIPVINCAQGAAFGTLFTA